MNIEAIKQIINPIVIFLTSGTGAILIGTIVKAIVSAVSAYKTKKASKLTEADKQDIANTLLKAMQGGLKVDMDAELDRATNRRITAIEQRMNDVAEVVNNSTEYLKATMAAVGDFKTISQDSRDKIKQLLGNTAIRVVDSFSMPQTPAVEIKQPAECQSDEADSKKLKY